MRCPQCNSARLIVYASEGRATCSACDHGFRKDEAVNVSNVEFCLGQAMKRDYTRCVVLGITEDNEVDLGWSADLDKKEVLWLLEVAKAGLLGR